MCKWKTFRYHYLKHKKNLIDIIIIFKSHRQHRLFWLSLAIHPYRPSLLESLDCIQCLHRADLTKSLLIGLQWHAYARVSIREHRLWVHLSSTSRALHVLLVFLESFLRWEVGDRTIVILCSTSSMIFSRQHPAFLHSFHLYFSQCVLLASLWWIHIVVWTQLQLERNLVLFYLVD